jgi:hypothetical protein
MRASQPTQCLRPLARTETRLSASQCVPDQVNSPRAIRGLVIRGMGSWYQTSSARASFAAGGKPARSAFASCSP